MDHVVPPNSDVLSQAIRRRLVSTPPSHMIGGDRESLRVNAWIRNGNNSGLYVRPRLFMPYYEEIKVNKNFKPQCQSNFLSVFIRGSYGEPD